jgi:signal transduction histidine kinase
VRILDIVSKQADFQFTGPGEMAGLCRMFDWASTPLGPTSTWSHSLRTMASAVLASRNPMLLFWGPDLVQFYNDAFRPSLGSASGPAPRHPRALGMRAKDFWTDVWETVGPQIDGVMTRGEAVWFEDLYLPIERGQGVLEDAWWTYSYSPVCDDDGSINGTLVVCLETTANVRARTEAERARAAAEDANRAKSEFLAVMSHELRTPLNAIDGYAEVLELGIHGPLNARQLEDVSCIRRSERHLLGLINDVLHFATVEAGTVRYSVEDVRLDEVLASCETLMTPQMRSKSMEAHFQPCPPGIKVRADRDKLQQIILNLLTNAIKFTEPHGRVDLACSMEGDNVLIRVTDTGCGIEAGNLDRIFDPFVQVDSRLARKYSGVGLGLAISRDLARGMGGEVSVESKPGSGSTFILSIPCAV